MHVLVHLRRRCFRECTPGGGGPSGGMQKMVYMQPYVTALFFSTRSDTHLAIMERVREAVLEMETASVPLIQLLSCFRGLLFFLFSFPALSL